MATVKEQLSSVNTNDHRRPAPTKQNSGSGGRFTILGSDLPGVGGGEISQLRQTFLRRAESGETKQRRRGDSYKRRMTFVGGGQNASPLFATGTSTRRLSLDDQGRFYFCSCTFSQSPYF